MSQDDSLYWVIASRVGHDSPEESIEDGFHGVGNLGSEEGPNSFGSSDNEGGEDRDQGHKDRDEGGRHERLLWWEVSEASYAYHFRPCHWKE